MNKRIKQLRIFFRTSNAAFNLVNAINEAFGRPVTQNEMQELHKLALEEVEKETPDLSKIDKLLLKMENIAENTMPKPPTFPKGGILTTTNPQ